MSLDGTARRIAPFAGIAFVAYALSFAIDTAPKLLPLTLSAGVAVAALGLPLCFPRERVPRLLGIVLPLACFPAIALLRWSAGGTVSGYGPLFGLPVLWLALYGVEAELVAGLATLAATLVVSDALMGGMAFESGELRRTLLLLAVSTVTGMSVKRLVNEVRAHAGALQTQTLALRSAERQALTARDLFAGVLRAATEYAIIATDPEGMITVFNEGAERMLGYRAADMVGRCGLLAVHVEREIERRAAGLGLKPGFEVLAEAPRYGIAETREWTYVRRDGAQLPVAATMTAMRDADDDVTGFIVIATFELLGPIVELFGVAAVITGFALGMLNVHFAILFGLFAVGYGVFLSIAAVTVEEFSFHRYHRWRDLGVAIAAAVLENFGYRQLHAVWRIRGLIDATKRREVGWGTMTRAGFTTAPPEPTSSR